MAAVMNQAAIVKGKCMELFKVCVAFDDGGDVWLGDAFEQADEICLALDCMTPPASMDLAIGLSGRSQPQYPARVVRLPKSKLEATIDSLHYEYLLPKSLPASLRTARHPAEVPEGYQVEFMSENYSLKTSISMQ